MSARRKPREASPIEGLKATVYVERSGACIKIDDVPAVKAVDVLAELLAAFRVAQKAYPEILPELTPVQSSMIVSGEDGEYEDGRKRAGFVPPKSA